MSILFGISTNVLSNQFQTDEFFEKKINAGHCDTNTMKFIQQCHFDLSDFESGGPIHEANIQQFLS